MNLNLFLLAMLMAGSSSATPARAADVGVSVSVGQPGFYGRLDMGDYPEPQLLYRQPRMIQRGPSGRPPVYMHVPPTHARNWRMHCAAYNACDERVYFVREGWYNNQYVPRYRDMNREARPQDPDGRRNDHRGNDRGQNR
jgi:hypothetical protein